MAETNNVFISWSGDRSKAAAEALREWLPMIIQAARPWMSDIDIEKGSRGLGEVARALEGMKVGIICLTPENLTAEWLLYEAGALSKTLDTKTRVCTYLLAGLQPKDVKSPLGMFQPTKADKQETGKLVRTINKHLDTIPLAENTLNTLFEKMWPDLDAKLLALPEPRGVVPPARSAEEMVAEILELTRSMTSGTWENSLTVKTFDVLYNAIASVQQEVRETRIAVESLEKLEPGLWKGLPKFSPLQPAFSTPSQLDNSFIESIRKLIEERDASLGLAQE